MTGEWTRAVHAALLAQDEAALARLFQRAAAVEGDAAASRSWLEAVSAFDAEAVTG